MWRFSTGTMWEDVALCAHRMASAEFPWDLTGVQYIKAVELPGATMVISNTDLAIEDSIFSGLSFFGQGALVVAASNVTFVNVTFSSNNNSAGAPSLWHNMLCAEQLLATNASLRSMYSCGPHGCTHEVSHTWRRAPSLLSEMQSNNLCRSQWLAQLSVHTHMCTWHNFCKEKLPLGK